MRIDRLELIRYGKFTDLAIDLPRAERDFHVIVGPNEAGKSTVRSAILDLLYGFPKSTAYAFVHPMPDLRLGATIKHNGETLEFHRTKGYKATLRTPKDSQLSDGVLAPLLGTANREFFEQMFGLDHERLVEGGAGILSASNDLGQILFEAAAGIDSLGGIRTSLEEEAGRLWSKRKSGERAYYRAEEAFEHAKMALKSATLRTRDWAEAHSSVEDLSERLEKAQQTLRSLKVRRNLLERTRRVCPLLVSLDSDSTELAKYASVPELPDTAGATLAEAERGLAVAGVERSQQEKLKNEAESQLKELKVNTRLIDMERDINALDEHRLQYRAYPTDIAKRQAEIRGHYQRAMELAAQLGWDVLSEEALRARVSAPAERSKLLRQIRQHSPLLQDKSSAEQAQQAKHAELKRAAASLEQMTNAQIPPGLRSAVAQARKLGDVEAVLRKLRASVRLGEADAQNAYAALGSEKKDPEALRTMLPPSQEAVQRLIQGQLADEAEARSLSGQRNNLDGQIADLKADIERFLEGCRPALREDVLLSREARDQVWITIKQHPAELAERATRYEQLVGAADALADTRHDTAQDAATLQAKQDQLAAAERDMASLQVRSNSLVEQMSQREQQWIGLRTECCLPELSFNVIGEWLAARQSALSATRSLDTMRGEMQDFEGAVARARTALATELVAVGLHASEDSLDTLVSQADDWMQAADQASGQQQTLERQIATAQDELKALSKSAETAQEKYNVWTQNWSETLDKAAISAQRDPDAVEVELDTIEQISKSLTDIQEIRNARIDPMQADLRSFEAMAKGLVDRVAPDLNGMPAADVAVELKRQLQAALMAKADAERLQSSAAAAGQAIENADANVRHIQATLAPLFHRSETTSPEELADAIARSDDRRRWQTKVAETQAKILEQGDGFTIDQLRADSGERDLASLRSELEELSSQETSLVNEVSNLSAAHQEANTKFMAMMGTGDAAKAEAERQEALAQMADAVARYVTVQTAVRLLSWAIEQYREDKQGPMLSAASQIFARLTLGSFERLVVDFDSDPPTLRGRRTSGQLVGVDGMSDGTRDQLYLALRLAALDMHLSQAHALPFIADDLFINFDAKRAKAGLEALGELSRKTQVLFLTHHDHLLPLVREVFGSEANIVEWRPVNLTEVGLA